MNPITSEEWKKMSVEQRASRLVDLANKWQSQNEDSYGKSDYNEVDYVYQIASFILNMSCDDPMDMYYDDMEDKEDF